MLLQFYILWTQTKILHLHFTKRNQEYTSHFLVLYTYAAKSSKSLDCFVFLIPHFMGEWWCPKASGQWLILALPRDKYISLGKLFNFTLSNL